MSRRHSWSFGALLPSRPDSSSASISSGASTTSKRKRFATVRNSFSFKRNSSIVIPEFEEEDEAAAAVEPTVVAKPQPVMRQSFCSENIAPTSSKRQSTAAHKKPKALKLRLDVPKDAFLDAHEANANYTPSPTGTLFIQLDGPSTVVLDDLQSTTGPARSGVSPARDFYLPGDEDSIADEDIVLPPASQLARSTVSPLGSPFAVELSEFPLPPFRFEQQQHDRLAPVRVSSRAPPSASRALPRAKSEPLRERRRFSTSGSALEWSHATLASLSSTPSSTLSSKWTSYDQSTSSQAAELDSPPVTPALSSCSTFSSPASLRELTQTPTSYRRPDESLYTVEEDDHDVLKQDIGSVMSQVDKLLADLDDARLEWQTEALLEEGALRG
ncbi:hypothetical protein ACM66B_004460 [Microbotryomycetes sp. NB124-2]